MGFKKHNWIKYGRRGNIIQIDVNESDGAKIDHFKTNNQKDYARIIKLIEEKYGFSPEISPEESVNEIKEQEANWLKTYKQFKWDN